MKLHQESERYPGRLIAVEGLDGSGKSTQLYLLKRWLEMKGLKVFFTEWNSSLLIKKATSKGKKRQLLTPTTFSLIHCTDFADRYERQILPLLKAGYLVLCDRYIYTAFARDTVRGCSQSWLQNLYSFAYTITIATASPAIRISLSFSILRCRWHWRESLAADLSSNSMKQGWIWGCQPIPMRVSASFREKYLQSILP